MNKTNIDPMPDGYRGLGITVSEFKSALVQPDFMHAVNDLVDSKMKAVAERKGVEIGRND